uniref:(northern house mosquito) hypothetical protein n=1 Tax=Culex pipiens TaxID=7175 RepID=A0A8D8C8M6_CULPI
MECAGVGWSSGAFVRDWSSGVDDLCQLPPLPDELDCPQQHDRVRAVQFDARNAVQYHGVHGVGEGDRRNAVADGTNGDREARPGAGGTVDTAPAGLDDPDRDTEGDERQWTDQLLPRGGALRERRSGSAV